MTFKRVRSVAAMFTLTTFLLSACTTPPKPVTVDGRKRIPVNTPEAIAAYNSATASSASRDRP